MNDFLFITLKDRIDLKEYAAKWFSSKWGVPEQEYLDCMNCYINNQTKYGWYLCLHNDKIVGGLGVIENDFHNRKDLTPNICAVYTEKEYRGKKIAGTLLNLAVNDLKSNGISPVYLITDHSNFYERYGWEFYCYVLGNDEDHESRMYIHR